MWSDKRGLEGNITFISIFLIVAIITSIIFYLNKFGIIAYTNEFFNLELVNSFIMITTIYAIIAGATSLNIHKLDEEKQIEINRAMIKYKICNIFFILYILLTILDKNRTALILAIQMEIIYISLYVLIRKSKSISLNDIQLKWRKEYDYPTATGESNVWWRFKPSFLPRYSVSIGKRIDRIRGAILFAIIILLSQQITTSTIIIIILIGAIEMIYLLEVIFGTYSKTTGICTGVVDVSSSKSNVVCHKVYITDYENKREIVFKIRGWCYINERDTITVIHSAIAKRVIEVEGLRLNIV